MLRAMQAGLNLEFARTEGLGLEEAFSRAAGLGYRFVEPYAYSHVSLAVNSHLTIHTATGYCHVDTAETSPQAVNALRREHGVELSALDAHATLLLPQLGVPYVRAAVDFAAEVECPIVMSDEGPVPEEWMPLDRAFDLMCTSLEAIIPHAQSRGVGYAMELHNALTARPDMLVKLLARFGPDELGVNFDTGNCFLAGNDPVDYLRRVADRVVHVHVKDIPESQLHERGKVTGTRVGVAAGDGVVDLAGCVGVLARAGYRGVLSVECDTLEQAERSLAYLSQLFAKASQS
ncbi:MAG: sugar phosphate isomerase/epimerase family protein [Planctomycetota bacterium]|jgi:sugar phosphate isomerase/epimerase